jgi:hypothetical protein
VLGASSGTLDLGVGGEHVNFHAVAQGEVSRNTMLIEAFGGVCLYVGVVRRSETMEGDD